jgi:hypothetical protein
MRKDSVPRREGEGEYTRFMRARGWIRERSKNSLWRNPARYWTSDGPLREQLDLETRLAFLKDQMRSRSRAKPRRARK